MAAAIFNKDKKFAGNDEAAIKGLKWYQELLKNAPRRLDGLDLGRPVPDDGRPARCALVQSWDEFFPGLDADDSKVKGLWQPAKPLQSARRLRPAGGSRLRRDPEPRPPGRLGHGAVEILEEPGGRLDVHAVGLLEGDHDPLHAGRRLRADALVLLRGSRGSRRRRRSCRAPRAISRRC